MTDPGLPALAVLAGSALAGAGIGSFACVLARRVAAGRDWVAVPSACEACGHRLGVAELIPLLSFAALGGRCRRCRAQIPRDHAVFELAGLLIPLGVALAVPGGPWLWGCLLGWMLLLLAGIDAYSFRLPLGLTLPLLVLGLVATLASAPERVWLHIGAAVLGWAALAGVAAVYRRLRGRAGLGGGDAWLLAAGGAWAGPEALPGIVAMAAFAGLAFAAGTAAGIAGSRAIPFGPFLAGGIATSWLAGPLTPM